jgi:hypothetical protein
MESVQDIKKRLLEIKSQGYVQTHRAHDTGIGKTLEDLLGIKENNIALPDIGEIELKSKRLESGSMLTIATKAPKPRGTNRKLYNNYKYVDEDGDYCLHTTSYGSKCNNLSFQLILTGDKIILDNIKKVEAYWPLSVFDDVLKSKSNRILLVLAETKGERAKANEQFHYTEAYLLTGLDMDRFKVAIATDKLKVDTRIGVYKSGRSVGKYHDHGTGFRINKKDYLYLFDTYEQLI